MKNNKPTKPTTEITAPTDISAEQAARLSELVRNGDIRCITIDTNVIEKNNCALDEGIVAQLTQFKERPFELLLSEVVIKEARRHLVDAHTNRLDKLRNLVPHATKYIGDAPELTHLTNRIEALAPPEDLADQEINRFLSNTNATVISASATSIDQVLQRYFSVSAPFVKTGPKRKEFPDAIALLGIEDWARQTSSGILVVSTDDDWARFCKESDTGKLHLVKDLAVALSIINASQDDRRAQATTRRARLMEQLRSGELILEAERKLKQALLEETRARGRSHLEFMAEIIKVETGPVQYSLAPEPTVIRDDTAAMVVLIDMQVHCTFWARFSFYKPDAMKPYGQGVYGHDTPITAGLLLTASDDAVNIEVLVKKENLAIDYGEVEPDEDNVISHEPDSSSIVAP